MRSLDEARDALQMTQEVIDFLIDGITRAGEPVAIVTYGSLARGEGREATTISSLFPLLREPRLRDTRLQPIESYGGSIVTWIFSS